MTEITLVKRGLVELTEDQQALLRAVDGVDDENRSKWRRFWSKIKKAVLGEVFRVELTQPRNPKYHRKFFGLLKVGFDAWQPPRKRLTYKGRPVTKSFDAFREEVTILAGFYDQTYGLDGRMTLRARSISFANMDEDEFEEVYSAVLNVLLERVLTGYKDRAEVDAVVSRLMEFA